ncbi:hypothetical protein FZ983_24935 [Azospirillum sp. B21]|uniref:hypothetical protein n=1 Tax=Azospirillum sp. B21 TaxID=2607496 RepID=UPI0011EC1572|nr:hypothetical protein [Azospirillum sp. B21]KAA0575808.1 hypothetical protein FZ983_24935 [Azospirillum sp. B21]
MVRLLRFVGDCICSIIGMRTGWQTATTAASQKEGKRMKEFLSCLILVLEIIKRLLDLLH